MGLILDGAGTPPNNDKAADSGVIKDASIDTFITDVIEASNEVPVVVDFWAPWCGPCKQLGPMLEKHVVAAKGKVRMVKVNVDENQEIAAQLRIQSIPTVYAFHKGRPVDGFAGAQPDSQVKDFVDKLARLAGPDDAELGIEELLEEAGALLDGGEVQDAMEVYRAVTRQDPRNPAALAGMLRCYMALGEVDMARRSLEKVPEDLAKTPEIEAVRAALDLREKADALGGAASLRQRVREAPDDLQARFDLALAAYGEGAREEAVEQLLEILRRDRAWNEGAARLELLKMFEAFGPADPLTVTGRRQLSSILFS